MWLAGRLAADFKTIADFRKGNGAAIRATRRQFGALCRSLNLFTQAIGAIDGRRFMAVNSRDRSFSRGSLWTPHGAGRGEHRALPVGA
jgi:transposase